MAQNINAFWVERASLSFVFLPPTFFPSFVYKCNYPHVNSSYLEIIWEYYCNQRCCPHPRQRQIVCCHAFQCSCTMLYILQASWTNTSPFIPLSLSLSQAIIQPQAHTWKAHTDRLEVGVYYGKAQKLVVERVQIAELLYKVHYFFIYRRSRRPLETLWHKWFSSVSYIAKFKDDLNWMGWSLLSCIEMERLDEKKKNIFTTEAALIMPGPHRGPFCLLTWATINTSSIQYNSACSLSSIIKSLDGPLTGLRTDLISKQNTRTVKKPAGVGIFGVFWYSCRNGLFILAARHSPATVGHWHCGLFCVAPRTNSDALLNGTTKAFWNAPAQQNPVSTALARMDR